MNFLYFRDSLFEDGHSGPVLVNSPPPTGSQCPACVRGSPRPPTVHWVSDLRHHPGQRVPGGPGQVGRVRGAGVRGAGRDLALSSGQVSGS